MEADTRKRLLRGKLLLDQAAAQRELQRAGETASPPSSPSSTESDEEAEGPPRRVAKLRPTLDVEAEIAFLKFKHEYPDRVAELVEPDHQRPAEPPNTTSQAGQQQQGAEQQDAYAQLVWSEAAVMPQNPQRWWERPHNAGLVVGKFAVRRWSPIVQRLVHARSSLGQSFDWELRVR